MVKTARHFLFGLLFLSGLSCWAPQIARGEDSTVPPLPPIGMQAPAWFPEDTETIAAAQSFQIERDAQPHKPNQHSPSQQSSRLPRIKGDLGIRLFALEGIWELNGEKYWLALAGNKVVLALRGSRNFDVVSAFGSLRHEGCAVIVFENNLAQGWLQTVRAGAKAVRRIESRDVFVFPSTTVMEAVEEQKPWQGTFLVLVRPNLLLCATSDRYLTEVLRRLDAKSPDRTPLLDLPEWKHIDGKSSAWLLRHIPGQRRNSSGLTMSGSNAGYRLVYLPAEKTGDSLAKCVRAIWTPEGVDARPEIRIQKDGTVVVSATILDPLLVWAEYHLPGEDGTLNAE